jgi:hypothetical protein
MLPAAFEYVATRRAVGLALCRVAAIPTQEILLARGLILTGALGAGKTTAQDILVREHGFWTPTTVTTRSVASDERYVVEVGVTDFTAGVIQRRYILPAKFGAHWYAWSASDFTHVLEDRLSRAVVNVRPYTALLLSALIADMLPVWIWVDRDELSRRISHRGAARDAKPETSAERKRQDEEDRTYETLFHHKVQSDENLVGSLLRLLES